MLLAPSDLSTLDQNKIHVVTLARDISHGTIDTDFDMRAGHVHALFDFRGDRSFWILAALTASGYLLRWSMPVAEMAMSGFLELQPDLSIDGYPQLLKAVLDSPDLACPTRRASLGYSRMLQVPAEHLAVLLAAAKSVPNSTSPEMAAAVAAVEKLLATAHEPLDNQAHGT